jgi:hypothetical protein
LSKELPEREGTCEHEVVYAGVVNLVRGFGILGAVDVWTCNKCRDIWCDEKRIEHQELPPEVGLPPRRSGTEWAVLLCENDGRLDWVAVQVRVGDVLSHSCGVFQDCNVKIGEGWGLTCQVAHTGTHRLILVRPSLNMTVSV